MDTSKIITAWRGLEPFAHWLVQTMDPDPNLDGNHNNHLICRALMVDLKF